MLLKLKECNILKSNNRKYNVSKIPLVIEVDIVDTILEMYL